MGDKRWYAIYTRSRTEKKTHQMLIDEGIMSYLPLVKTLKQWSDRKKWVEEPLFKSYIFVCIDDNERQAVLNIPGLVRFITFEGKAVSIPDQQILAIKQFVNTDDFTSETISHFEKGDKVEIVRGQLYGLNGHLIDFHGKQKVKIEIDAIGHSIILTIPKSHLQRIH
jgi:transcription antitermination factor NusG